MQTKVVPIYGLLAEFDNVDAIIAAAQKTRDAGYRRFDCFAPFPVHGLTEAMGFRRSRVAMIVLIGGICGCIAAYAMQWYANTQSYPLIIGGKPLNSWPAWIPIMFEMTVGGAAFGAVFGMLALNGLPQPYHPLFNVPVFQLASRDRFFLCIESRDPMFAMEKTRRFLESLHPMSLSEVPR